MDVTLRDIRDSDLPVLISQMSDRESIRMAAFTAQDRADIERHWTRVRQELTASTYAIVGDPEVVLGHIAVFGPSEEREVTYWIGRDYWGSGAATSALRALLARTPERPLHARAAADNAGSIRVLQKCGFVVTGRNRDFTAVRGEEIEELLLTLVN